MIPQLPGRDSIEVPLMLVAVIFAKILAPQLQLKGASKNV
jgi:hypothetical protein